MEQEQEFREKTCFFSGHRDILRKDYPLLQKKIEQKVEHLIAQGVTYFGVGGAMGFDTLAALTVIKLRRRYPHIRLAVILPCQDYPNSWREEDKEVYERVLRRANKVVYTAERYYNGCMYKRNRHMADRSGWCICYLDRPTGGTAYTISYALSVGVKIINLAMDD